MRSYFYENTIGLKMEKCPPTSEPADASDSLSDSFEVSHSGIEEFTFQQCHDCVNKTPLKNAGPYNNFQSFLKSLQFYWFLGHLLEVTSFSLYLASSLIDSQAIHVFFYRITLIFILFTYFVVLHLRYKKNTIAYIVTHLFHISKDDNFQYFMFALFLYSVSGNYGIVEGSLYSYTIFSTFHTLSYLKQYIIPNSPLRQSSHSKKLAASIERFMEFYKKYGLYIAANSEILLIVRFIWRSPYLISTGCGSLINDFSYVNIFLYSKIFCERFFIFLSLVIFIKFRFDSSRYTYSLIRDWDQRLRITLDHKFMPKYLPAFYSEIRGLAITYLPPLKPQNSHTRGLQGGRPR